MILSPAPQLWPSVARSRSRICATSGRIHGVFSHATMAGSIFRPQSGSSAPARLSVTGQGSASRK
eukprot:scaffold327186_cov46-Prasinocladus_malaysianus.AAC.1